MRSTLLFSLLLVACAGRGAPPAPVATPPGEPAAHEPAATRRPADAHSNELTHFEGDGLALDLPGQWIEHPIPGAHELRKGEREQIIVSILAPLPGLDDVASAARLGEIQERAIASRCKRAGETSAPAAATMPPRATRFRFVCEEPRVAATFAAVPWEGNLLSYEHYWYRVPESSAELDRADDIILATLHHKPATTECPTSLIAEGASRGGLCLESAVLGTAVVEACKRELKRRGFTPDNAVADEIGRQTSKKLVCYQKPR
jgi:hypothetical protein